MSFIRGKIESPRELRPEYHVDGHCPAYRKDGKWYSKETDEELVVQDFFEVFPEALETE